jgi:uncharacterized membrane protein
MNPIIAPDNAWPIWALVLLGVAVCIHLEQTRKWAAQISGPVLALLIGMALSNFKLMPVESPSYDIIETYLVRAAIPLLLFRANIVRILRETGPMFLAVNIASAGTVIGAFIAAFLFRGSFDRVPEVTGIMTASYVGGGVNFIAVKESYQVSETLTSPLMVADNFIMAGMFVALLVIASSRFWRRLYPHPHSLQGDKEDVAALAARHWRRKEVSLLDIAQALAIAFSVAAISVKLTDVLKAQVSSKIIQSIFANPFVLITFLSVGITTLFHRWTDRIQGAEDLGMYLLYLFFIVIGLKADFMAVVSKMPVLFSFCLVMALANLVFTLAAGKLLRLNLEELLLSVNATLGGPPSAAAMAISRGWSNLVLPGLLAGIWGYIIGTFVGILVTEILLKLFKSG